MALQTGGPIFFPNIGLLTQGHTNAGTDWLDFLLNVDGEKVGYAFEVPKTGTLDKVKFLIGNTMTAADDMTVSFQDLDSSGFPDGTADQSVTVSAASIVANAMVTTGSLIDGGSAKRSVTKGDRLSIVVEFGPFVDGNFEIRNWDLGGHEHAKGATYGLTHNGTVWSKASVIPTFVLIYDDASIALIEGSAPMKTRQALSYNSTDSPDEHALKFQVPWPCRSSGFWGSFDIDNAADVKLYEGTTEKATASLISSFRGGTDRQMYQGKWDTAFTLTKDTDYFISLLPTTTSDVGILSYDADAAGDWAQSSLGTLPFGADRVNAGAWADRTTRRMFIGIIIDQLDDGVGGGGGGGVGKLTGIGGGLAG